jgi:hypothetical protein
VKQRPMYVIEELRGFGRGGDYVTTGATGTTAGSGTTTSTDPSF